MSNQGKLVVVSGPSGVGKTTICKAVARNLDNACISISVTTRPKSGSEIDGEDYYFISKKEFQQRIEKGLFLEYAEVFDNLYGTPKDKVDEALQDGKTVILEIDVQGGEQLKTIYPDAIMIFILPPAEKELVERMKKRGRDKAEVAAERLNGAGTEIAAAWQYYEHMVINDDLQHAIKEVTQIIKSSIPS